MCITFILAGQRLSKNVIAAKNTHSKIKEMLDESFSMQSMTYKRKVDYYFFPELLVFTQNFMAGNLVAQLSPAPQKSRHL
jgi:hypothetical protein